MTTTKLYQSWLSASRGCFTAIQKQIDRHCKPSHRLPSNLHPDNEILSLHFLPQFSAACTYLIFHCSACTANTHVYVDTKPVTFSQFTSHFQPIFRRIHRSIKSAA